MTRKILLLSALFAGLSVTMAATAQAPKDDESHLPLNEFMGHVLQRNAEQLWTWTAWLIDEKGEHSGRPVTEQQWEEAESDALTIQQLTYTLQHSTIRIDDPRWDRHLEGLRAAATASADAAEHKDYDALERAGEAINDQCIACHMTFAPELETPPPG
ncbi:MAG TPA: hypothetical protein VF475_15690 [Sphingobium sp.]